MKGIILSIYQDNSFFIICKRSNQRMEINLKQTYLGIELGSTRIKAVLINDRYETIASGEYSWENEYRDGLWTYELADAMKGIQQAYRQIKETVEASYGKKLDRVGSIGVSAMMHGYLPFNQHGEQLADFRTWRNTNTSEAAQQLTEEFQFNIPLRWSVAHLYQAIIDQETHINDIDFMTTLAGYIHWQLTGEKVLGIGDASGMFPVNPDTLDYETSMVDQFNHLLKGKNISYDLIDIFPKVLSAGEAAGQLTDVGAKYLDPSGDLQAGITVCPPEGDAGTGMVATNSIKEHTGNVSAGTSIFSMLVLEDHLTNYYKEIDVVNTPDGKVVAMVHCNNFTSDINDWVSMFEETFDLLGFKVDRHNLFTKLFESSLEADEKVGDLVHCSYYSGEPITNIDEGRPLFVRTPNSRLTISNFMRSQINAALATLKIGMDLLIDEEKVQIDNIFGHGGFFKTEKVGQQLLADALNTKVTLLDNAEEGGAWGMALLAAYHVKSHRQTLEDFLLKDVFKEVEEKVLAPTKEGVIIFNDYVEKYHSVLQLEKLAGNLLK